MPRCPQVGFVAIALVLAALGCNTPANGSFSRAEIVPTDAIADDGSAIQIDPNTIAIIGVGDGSTSMASGTVSGTGSVVDLAGIDLVDPTGAFQIISPPCPGGACTFPPGAQPLGNGLAVDITCVPMAGNPRSATVTVHAANGTSDQSLVTCDVQATGPAIIVPGSLGPLVTQVNTPASGGLTITNSGDVPIDISLDPPGGAWTAGSCVAPGKCTIPTGTDLVVMMTFLPTVHGDSNVNLAVHTNPDVGTKNVLLQGTGLGGKLQVDTPAAPAFSIDFGTIAKNQLATSAVLMTNAGNQQSTITPSNPGAPFTVPTAPIDITGDNGTASFPVSCMSATPGGPFDRTIDLALSPNTYDANTTQIAVHCTIANTNVQVAPNPVDMGNLQVGQPSSVVTVSIANPGNAAVTVQAIRLVNAPAALTLGTPSLALPATLPAKAMMTTTVELATTGDVVLAGVTLEVEVIETETVVLELPVTGSVGTPSAKVIPDQLDLGTVCVGTPITGTITMTNDGTATLTMQRPTMSSPSFSPLFRNPTDYPTPLVPGASAMVDVMPATSSAGRIEAVLEWDVDVPLAPFQIPVALEFIASGTAVSPSRLVFGTLDLDEESPARVITLENCGTEPTVVAYSGVTATRGGANAWHVLPPADERTLLPDEKMQITVSFAPTTPGAHVAELRLDLGGQQRIVTLEGDAIGTAVGDTSFYACNCTTGTPAGGWPIGIALVLVLRRRRAVSARCPSESS
ncbi:MAG TPA: choice-of-anchor D domain-containing protein [Kofleriaceae bacterium]|nr:choice-of-anchor D domain-containing protein [Kofleriaceae bacterium]